MGFQLPTSTGAGFLPSTVVSNLSGSFLDLVRVSASQQMMFFVGHGIISYFLFGSLNTSFFVRFLEMFSVCLRQLQGSKQCCGVLELFEHHNSMAIDDLFLGEF